MLPIFLIDNNYRIRSSTLKNPELERLLVDNK